MKIKLFLTFDHELPLGKLKTSYSASLFEPSQKVMDIANKLGVKVTFFTDILCATRFKDWDYHNFYVPYKNQLQTALKQGHDIQLHIHPHWLTTSYENGNYVPSSAFGLSDFNNDKAFGGIEGIIKQSITHLNEICNEQAENYKCLAYRAGGYNIAPNTKEIITALHKHGIKYDCSMARGYYFKSGISEVDFRRLPASPNWTIDPNNLHKSSKNEGIIEVPIATIPKTPFEVPTLFKMKKYAARAPISHGYVIHQNNKTNKLAKFRMLFSARMLSFDNYTLSLNYLLKIIEYNVRKNKQADTLMLSIISHPKSMSDYSFELMEGFVKTIRQKYPEAEFLSFSQLDQAL